jgi:hypothetical protein
MEDILPQEERDEPLKGTALVQAIEAEAERRGLDPKDLGEVFELQPSYWGAILQRNRSCQGLAKRRLQKVADFLNSSVINVMSLAELVEPQDFVITSTIDDQLNAGYTKFSSDPQWLAIAPSPEAWDNTPREVKVAFILVYERLFGEQLIAKLKVVSTVVEHEEPLPAAPAVQSRATGSSPSAPPKKPRKAVTA